ncbi:hypothetical protein CsSME_00042451 [Camellia sinensis var. sinensis]
MGQDFWDARRWQREFETKQVLVMTAQILLNILRHSIIKMEAINLLILDECHHAVKKHPYSLVMSEFYHTTPTENRPSVFGMTASPFRVLIGAPLGFNFLFRGDMRRFVHLGLETFEFIGNGENGNQVLVMEARKGFQRSLTVLGFEIGLVGRA